MKRSLVKHGKVTLMVSLPSKWLKNNNLNKGDEVNISTKDNNIIISGKGIDETKKTSFKISHDNEKHIRTILGNFYQRGYDEVELRFEKNSFIRTIEKALRTLFAFEIVEKKEKYCIIQNIGNDNEEMIPILIKKIYYINKTKLDLIKNIKTKQYKETNYSQETSTKLYELKNYLLRLIQKNKKDYVLYNFAYQIDKIGSNLKYIYERGEKNKIELSKSDIEYIDLTSKMLKDLFEKVYLKKDLEKSAEMLFYLRSEKFWEDIELQYKKTKNPQLIALIQNTLRQIRGLTASLQQLSF